MDLIWIIGQSGSGKTTLAKKITSFFNDSKIICDDKIFVGVKDEKIIAWSSPWLGKEKIGINGHSMVDMVIISRVQECKLVTDKNQMIDAILTQIMPISINTIKPVSKVINVLIKQVPFFQVLKAFP